MLCDSDDAFNTMAEDTQPHWEDSHIFTIRSFKTMSKPQAITIIDRWRQERKMHEFQRPVMAVLAAKYPLRSFSVEDSD